MRLKLHSLIVEMDTGGLNFDTLAKGCSFSVLLFFAIVNSTNDEYMREGDSKDAAKMKYHLKFRYESL